MSTDLSQLLRFWIRMSNKLSNFNVKDQTNINDYTVITSNPVINSNISSNSNTLQKVKFPDFWLKIGKRAKNH